MSKSKIEWTDAVWNPVTGCTKVSEGCRNCYAERLWPRLRAMGNPAYKDRNFNDVTCHHERLEQPLEWKKPRRIFVNSMSDLFHDDVPDEFIRKVFQVIGDAQEHTFMILTKRPKRMQKIISGFLAENDFATLTGTTEPPFPWPNAWLGVSVENQAAADERIPILLQTPAAVRFISAEPLLGPVDLTSLWKVCSECGSWEIYEPRGDARYCDDCGADVPIPKTGIDWVIAGGESGPNARPMHPDWVRSLRDQCQAAGAKFFFKQWGEWKAFYDRDKDDPDWSNIPEEKSGIKRLNIEGGHGFHGDRVTYLKRVGKKTAGRELDGRTWDELPENGGQHAKVR